MAGSPSKGISGYGTTLSGPSGIGLLGHLTRINLSGFEVKDIDISTMDSPEKCGSQR